MLVGAAGLLVAPLIWFGIPEPVRGGQDVDIRPSGAMPLPLTLRALAAKPSFWLLAFGAAASSIIGYGLFAWFPSVLVRSFGFDLVGASVFFGSIVLIGGVGGIWLGGWLSDRTGQGRRRPMLWCRRAPR